MGDNKNNKTVIAVFAAAFALSVGISAVAEAQSRSARGVDMRSLQNQQANPCDSIGKLHVPIHPSSDAQGCIDVFARSPTGNNLSVDASATFEEETTFEDTSQFKDEVTFDGDAVFNQNSTNNNEATFNIPVTHNDEATFNEGLIVGMTTVCNSAREGAIRYNKGIKKQEFCDGTTWSAIGASGTVDAIFCRKFLPADRMKRGQNLVNFEADDCGGTLPDTNYLGVLSAARVCGGAINLEVRQPFLSEIPGITFWKDYRCGAGAGPSHYAVNYIRVAR